MNKKKLFKTMIVFLVFASFFVFVTAEIDACTTLVAGQDATVDGSVLMAFCNDGNRKNWLEIHPRRTFTSGTTIPMLSNRPIPPNLEVYEQQKARGYDQVGELRVPEEIPEETYHYMTGAARFMGRPIFGFNEHGVATASEYTPINGSLVNDQGAFGGGTNHWTTSLNPLALMQSRTAREAIEVMGRLSEEHGFQYYFDAGVGLSFIIVDRQEAWLMELFPPGPVWTPDSDEPGAVWAAQRIPDDEFFVHANRSRIAEIDLEDEENFMASPNVHSLAEDLGLWDPDDEFIWWQVYGTPGGTWNCLREWVAYDTIAPSKGFEATGDAELDRYPVSVKPDELVEKQDFVDLMRNQFEGTEWDVTADPAFEVDGEKSPLARAQGPSELFDLVSELADRDVSPVRAIATDTTTQWYLIHNRDWLPDPVSSSIWFSNGPSYTSVLAPLYPVVTDLPLSWTDKTDFDRVNRDQVAWNMNLVYNLSHIRHQDAIKDIKNVIEPAEEYFFAIQEDFEEQVIEVYEEEGRDAAVEMLTEYSYYWFNQVHNTYDELVDYMLYKYVFEYPEIAPPKLPQIVPEYPRLDFGPSSMEIKEDIFALAS